MAKVKTPTSARKHTHIHTKTCARRACEVETLFPEVVLHLTAKEKLADTARAGCDRNKKGENPSVLTSECVSVCMLSNTYS